MAATGRAAVLTQGTQSTLMFTVSFSQIHFQSQYLESGTSETDSKKRSDSRPSQEGVENVRHTFLHRCCSPCFQVLHFPSSTGSPGRDGGLTGYRSRQWWKRWLLCLYLIMAFKHLPLWLCTDLGEGSTDVTAHVIHRWGVSDPTLPPRPGLCHRDVSICLLLEVRVGADLGINTAALATKPGLD